MTEMCKLRKPYKCAKCGQEMLFFLTNKNTLIDYKRFFNEHGETSIGLRHAMEHLNIRYFKCLCCNKIYVIDWTTGYPVPVMDKNNLTKFMRKG